MEKNTKASATFNVKVELLNELDKAVAAYKNPLLTGVRLIFTDDQPNANKQGIKKSEFSHLVESMTNMPIKAHYDENGLGGHDDTIGIGVITNGEIRDNTLVATGALWSDEFPDLIEHFKTKIAEGTPPEFSWEVRYRDSEIDDNGTEWLTDVTTKAITAVRFPAYEGRTPMIAISSLVQAISEELESRGVSNNEVEE